MDYMKMIVLMSALVCVSDACTKLASSAQPIAVSVTTSSTTTTTTTGTTIPSCNTACVASTSSGQLAVDTTATGVDPAGVTQYSVPSSVPTIACSGAGSVATGQIAEIVCTSPVPAGNIFVETAVALDIAAPRYTSNVQPIPVRIVCGANGWETPELPGELVVATACIPIS